MLDESWWFSVSSGGFQGQGPWLELPKMIQLDKRAYMLFDGDCGICTWLADLAMRMDVQRFFYIEPYQRVPESEIQTFGISYAHCAQRLQLITRQGKVHSGAFAVNNFLAHYFPWKLLVVLLYVVPPLLFLEIITYALVARNRTRLSRWLGMKACVAQK